MDRRKPEEIRNGANKRIAVIGGGMTGLALAYFLARVGFRVSVLEKGKELSGLVAFSHVEGVPIERFYHHFFTSDSYLLDLLEELGLSDRILWHEGGSAVYYGGRVYPLRTKLDYLRLPFLSPASKIRGAGAAALLRFQKPENLSPKLTAESYLRGLFGTEGWEKLWRPLLVNKFGEGTSHTLSAQWAAKRIQIRSQSERHGREVLGYLTGSYRVLAEGLRQGILERGGQILLNYEVTTLIRSPGGGFGINDEQFDAVVSTIAPELLKRIAPELELTSVPYRAAICPLFVMRSSPTPYYWINILDTRVPFSVIVNQQNLLPPGYYGGRFPLYVGHYVSQSSELLTKSDGELAEYYLGHLRKVFPGIDGDVVSCEIGRTKYAQPVMSAPWEPLRHTTNLPNLYTTSMAHIFPEDRGVNYAIREAVRIRELLTKRS